MTHVAMDTSFPDSDAAATLEETLQERHAWCHALRLWAWGLDQNKEDGRFRMSHERLAAVCDYRGDPNLFVAAMVGAGLLRREEDGSFYICGWGRNSEFFKKKNRMRTYREEKKKEREAARVPPRETPQERHESGTRAPTPSLSPSPSPPQLQEREICARVSKPELMSGDDLQEEGTKRFGLIAGHLAEIVSLLPIKREEFEYVMTKTNGKSWPYFVKVIRTRREEAASPKQQRSSGHVGYHPGSKEFGEGDQQL